MGQQTIQFGANAGKRPLEDWPSRRALDFSARVQYAQTALVNGNVAIVVAPQGLVVTLMTFDFADSASTRIEIVARPGAPACPLSELSQFLEQDVVLPLAGDLQVFRGEPEALETVALQDSLGGGVVHERSGLDAVQAQLGEGHLGQ